VNSTTQDFPVMNVRRVGTAALLIEVDQPLDWHAELLRRREAGELTAVDIVPGARTVLIDGVSDPAELSARLRGWRPGADRVAGGHPGLPRSETTVEKTVVL
jgi:hypothetical protein